MRRFLRVYVCLLLAIACAKPATERANSNTLLIDAAPSVVAYQGSSQTHTRFVIAPMGRSLGYVAPTNVNYTIHRTARLDGEQRDLDFLNISPVYVHQQ